MFMQIVEFYKNKARGLVTSGKAQAKQIEAALNFTVTNCIVALHILVFQQL